VPNPQELETFNRSKLNWTELSDPLHAELFDWYRRLIRLRKDKLAGPLGTTSRGRAAVKFDAGGGWLTFIHGSVLCVFNFAAGAQRVRMPSGEWDLAMRSDMKEAEPVHEAPGRATLIYRRRE
jgi:maltooligosyltrehalose trehalohydrolase